MIVTTTGSRRWSLRRRDSLRNDGLQIDVLRQLGRPASRLKFGIRHSGEGEIIRCQSMAPTFVDVRRGPAGLGQCDYPMHKAVIREPRPALALPRNAGLAGCERAHLLLRGQLGHAQHSAVRPFEMSAAKVVSHAWRPTGGSSVHPGWWHYVSDARELNLLRHAGECSA